MIKGKVVNEGIKKKLIYINGKQQQGYITDLYMTGMNSKEEVVDGYYTAKLPAEMVESRASSFTIWLYVNVFGNSLSHSRTCQQFEKALELGYLERKIEDKK